MSWMITTLILRLFITSKSFKRTIREYTEKCQKTKLKKIRTHGDSKDIDALQLCDDLLMNLSTFLIGPNGKE